MRSVVEVVASLATVVAVEVVAMGNLGSKKIFKIKLFYQIFDLAGLLRQPLVDVGVQ